MEDVLATFTTSATAVFAIAVISLLVKILKIIDDKMDSWSLTDNKTILGVKATLLRWIGGALSTAAAVVIAVVSGYTGWQYLYAIPGAIAIFWTQYGVSKVGWTAVFKFAYYIITLVIKAFKGTATTSDVTNVTSTLDDVADSNDSTGDSTGDDA